MFGIDLNFLLLGLFVAAILWVLMRSGRVRKAARSRDHGWAGDSDPGDGCGD